MLSQAIYTTIFVVGFAGGLCMGAEKGCKPGQSVYKKYNGDNVRAYYGGSYNIPGLPVTYWINLYKNNEKIGFAEYCYPVKSMRWSEKRHVLRIQLVNRCKYAIALSKELHPIT